MESILEERKKACFTSLRDFVIRTSVSQPIIENLIKVGAFDTLEDREGLLVELGKLRDIKNNRYGTRQLFNDEPPLPGVTDGKPDIDIRARIQVERELLSLDLSAHPLDLYFPVADFTRMKDLRLMAAGTTVQIAGSVIRYQTPPTRNGKRVVYVIMEDGTGIADVTVFSDVQEKCGQVLFREGWLTVKGKIRKRGPKALSIIADDLAPLLKRN